MYCVTLEQIQQALDSKSPDLVNLFLSFQQHYEPEKRPLREDVPTFDTFLSDIRSSDFRKLDKEDQMLQRLAKLEALESKDAEEPLSNKLKLHSILTQLWEGEDVFSRNTLKQLLETISYEYGVWRGVKSIFKEAEANHDIEIYGIIASRLDVELANRTGCYHAIGRGTLQYLVLRSWRYIRNLATERPASYTDMVVEVLACYKNLGCNNAWLYNHIIYHNIGTYKRSSFRVEYGAINETKHRAFLELWKRSPRPVINLLSRSQCGEVALLATRALKADFRTAIRDVEVNWVRSLAYGNHQDETVKAIQNEAFVWIIENVPSFSQDEFRDLGLHDAVLNLLRSNATKGRDYAIKYVSSYARDLDFEMLLELFSSAHAPLHKLAADLLSDKDPRKEVTLEMWGQVMDTSGGYKVASAALRKHYGAKELTKEWFKERLLSSRNRSTINFVFDQLPKLHPIKTLGSEYFVELIDEAQLDNYRLYRFATEQLDLLKLDELDVEVVKRLAVHPQVSHNVMDWVRQGKLSPSTFGIDWLKLLSYQPEWDSSEWVTELKRSATWAKDIEFNTGICTEVHAWLGDVRSFQPHELGFEWLMVLVKRSEPLYHDFAVDLMIKAFLPADFANESDDAKAEEVSKSDEDVVVDLDGQTFMFTGKMATMTRAETKSKVVDANGKSASGVTKNLNYLVIGDEGSPLYGEGRKGSKQVKAEALRDSGVDIKIISETAFLQMLAGEQREFSESSVEDGCETLWEMMTGPGPVDAPLAKFALKYIRLHHPEICLLETDRPVDPGAEVPESFLTFDRLKVLFHDDRKPLRDYALELARYEFKKWSPPIEGVIEMCESPYEEVREFVSLALTAEDTREHIRYRLDPAILTADAVYRFCESQDASTRSLGIQLINRQPDLRLPEELFRLTESPDRQVRAFAIQSFWSLYHDRGSSAGWKPKLYQAKGGKQTEKQAKEQLKALGEGAPEKPSSKPAQDAELLSLLRRILYEIPPGRPDTAGDGKLKPLASGKAKLYLIETLRDLALEDVKFATLILPLLEEFMDSRGKQEMAACLVAVTRIKNSFPELVA